MAFLQLEVVWQGLLKLFLWCKQLALQDAGLWAVSARDIPGIVMNEYLYRPYATSVNIAGHSP